MSEVETVTREADEAARLSAQKRRNVWLGLMLFGFVLIVGLVSALRLAENIQRTAGA
ncbi:MAG: hypothetical protein AAGK23_13110 [Pseudomonadota bacterium]